MSQTQDLAPAKVLQDLLSSRKNAIAAVAAKGLTPERIIKIVMGAAMRNPTLLRCDAKTIMRSVLQAVELGLEPGGALGEAHLVPFWNSKASCYECQLVVDYKGLCALMYRSGLIEFIDAEVVYEGDVWEYERGLNPVLRHIPADQTIDPQKITHAYCVIGIRGGAKVFKVMNRLAIERIRTEFSQQGKDNKGPWRSHYAEQCKKTVLKNASKTCPKSIEVARVIEFDNAQDTGDWSAIEFDSPDALPMTDYEEVEESKTETQVSKTAGRIRGAANALNEIGLNATEEATIREECGSDNVRYEDLVQALKDAKATGIDACRAKIAEWTGRMPL